MNGPPVHSDCAARGRVSESLPHAWTVISTVLVIGGDSGEPETGLRRTTAQSDRRRASLPTGDVATLGKSPTACRQPTCEHNGKSGDKGASPVYESDGSLARRDGREAEELRPHSAVLARRQVGLGVGAVGGLRHPRQRRRCGRETGPTQPTTWMRKAGAASRCTQASPQSAQLARVI